MSGTVRYTLIAISLTGLTVAAYYRIQSQRSGDSLDRTKEGWAILIGIRLTGLLLAASIGAWLRNPAWFEAAVVPLPDGVRWIGVTVFGCAFAWLCWMFHSLGRNLTDTVVTRRNATFVEHGPYRFVRNPMYTGILFLGLSLGLALGTWLIPLLSGVLFTLFAIRTRIEEQYLIERFGNVYRQYMERVGRFFPRF